MFPQTALLSCSPFYGLITPSSTSLSYSGYTVCRVAMLQEQNAIIITGQIGMRVIMEQFIQELTGAPMYRTDF